MFQRRTVIIYKSHMVLANIIFWLTHKKKHYLKDLSTYSYDYFNYNILEEKKLCSIICFTSASMWNIQGLFLPSYIIFSPVVSETKIETKSLQMWRSDNNNNNNRPKLLTIPHMIVKHNIMNLIFSQLRY